MVMGMTDHICERRSGWTVMDRKRYLSGRLTEVLACGQSFSCSM